MHSLVAVQRRNHTCQGPLADRPCRHLFPTGATPPAAAAAAAAAMSCATQRPVLSARRSGREDQARSGPFAQGEGRPSASGICPSSRAWCRAGCRCPLASCGNTHQRSEDQIDQEHFSFRLRLCGRRAWLARQLMLPRAAPESGTRGRISALPCLASPVSQYAAAALRCFASDVHSHAARVQPLAGEGRVLAPQ